MSLAGFKTAVFPVIKAPVVIPIAIADGKLKGAIIPHTPYGLRMVRVFSFGLGCSVSFENPLLISN